MQQNSKFRLCGNKDKTLNCIKSQVAQKEYKTRSDWVGKVIHWELCKKLKFEHTSIWYIHKPESVFKKWDQ